MPKRRLKHVAGSQPDETYSDDAASTLDAKGTMVEPDARRSIKGYLRDMGLTVKGKDEADVSELRRLVRTVLIKESATRRAYACPACGGTKVVRWAIDPISEVADWSECVKCGASGRIETFELNESKRVEEDLTDEQASTMGRMNFMATIDADPDEDEPLKEFADWADTFAGDFDNRRYETLARQVYDGWPEHGPEVDWAKVVELYVKSRARNLHTEVDKNKLYEKVLSFAEDHYDGNVPPTSVVSQHQYGGGSK